MEPNINEKIKPEQEIVLSQNNIINQNQQLEELENENEQLFLKIKELLNAQCKQMKDNSNLKNILEQLSIKRVVYKEEKNKLNMINKSHRIYKENYKLKKLLDDLNSLHKYSNNPFHTLAENFELNIKKEGNNYIKISEIYKKLNELVDFYKFKLKKIDKIDYERRRKVTIALQTIMKAEHGFNNSKRVPELVEIFKNELKNLLNNNSDSYLSEKEEYKSIEKDLNSIESIFKNGFLEIAKNFNFKNSIYAYTNLNNFVEKFEDILNKAKSLIRSGKIKKGIFLRNREKEGYFSYKNKAINKKENDLIFKESFRKINFKYYEELLDIFKAFLPGYGYDEFYDKALDLAHVVKNHDKLYEFTEEEIAIINEVDRKITEELKAFEKMKANIRKFNGSLYAYLCYLNQNVFSEDVGDDDL